MRILLEHSIGDLAAALGGCGTESAAIPDGSGNWQNIPSFKVLKDEVQEAFLRAFHSQVDFALM